MAPRLAVWMSVLLIGAGANRGVLAEDIFEPPTRLLADGKIIDTGAASWGHSSPCVEDLDGDGLPDLVLGDFSGKFHVYKNVGRPNRPVYHDVGNLQAGGEDAAVRIYCCVGGQPRFVDLDGDGIRDMIASSYDPGSCFLFRGLADHKLAARAELLDKSETPVRSSPKQRQTYESFGSFYAPVDWDADGDFDLLIGCFSGELKLRINDGDAKQMRFAAENQIVSAGEGPLKVVAHCCPLVADWDGDGLWDILAGSDDGSVTWFRNVGVSETPTFAPGSVLVEASSVRSNQLLRWTEEEIVPGHRSQIEAVDQNGDGKLDLLVGDFCTAFDPRQDLDDQETRRLTELVGAANANGRVFAEKLEALQMSFQERYPGDAMFSPEADAEWRKTYREFRASPEAKEWEERDADLALRIAPLLATTHSQGDRMYDLEKPHGYVWLYKRK